MAEVTRKRTGPMPPNLECTPLVRPFRQGRSSSGRTPRSILPFPDLVQAETACLTVRTITVDHLETGAQGKGAQFTLGEQVHVTQADAPMSPVHEMVIRIDIGLRKSYHIPGNDPLSQAGAGAEIPDGKRQAPGGGETLGGLFQQADPAFVAGNVVQGGQQKNVTIAFSHFPRPLVIREIGQPEPGPGETGALPGKVQNEWTGIDAEVRPSMTALGQAASEFARATPQIEHTRLMRNRKDGAQCAGLQPAARAGEFLGEGFVEFPVNLPQFGGHVLSHTGIIRRHMRVQAWLESRKYKLKSSPWLG